MNDSLVKSYGSLKKAREQSRLYRSKPLPFNWREKSGFCSFSGFFLSFFFVCCFTTLSRMDNWFRKINCGFHRREFDGKEQTESFTLSQTQNEWFCLCSCVEKWLKRIYTVFFLDMHVYMILFSWIFIINSHWLCDEILLF